MRHIYFLACVYVVAGRAITNTAWDSPKERLTYSKSYTTEEVPKTLGAHFQPFSIHQKHPSLLQTQTVAKLVDGFSPADSSARRVNRAAKVTSKEPISTLFMTTEDLFPSETESILSQSHFPVFKTDMPHQPKTLTLTETFETIPTATFHIPKSFTVPTIIIPRPSISDPVTTLSSVFLPKATASSITTASPSLMDSDSRPNQDVPSKGEIASIVLGVIATLLSIAILSYLCNQCVARYRKRARPKPPNMQLEGFRYPDPRLSRSYTAIPSPRDSRNEYLPQSKLHTTTFNGKPGEQLSRSGPSPLANEGFPDLARYAAMQDNTLVPSDTGAVACEPTRARGTNEGLNYLSRYSSSEYSQDEDQRGVVGSPWKRKP